MARNNWLGKERNAYQAESDFASAPIFERARGKAARAEGRDREASRKAWRDALGKGRDDD